MLIHNPQALALHPWGTQQAVWVFGAWQGALSSSATLRSPFPPRSPAEDQGSFGSSLPAFHPLGRCLEDGPQQELLQVGSDVWGQPWLCVVAHSQSTYLAEVATLGSFYQKVICKEERRVGIRKAKLQCCLSSWGAKSWTPEAQSSQLRSSS